MGYRTRVLREVTDEKSRWALCSRNSQGSSAISLQLPARTADNGPNLFLSPICGTGLKVAVISFIFSLITAAYNTACTFILTVPAGSRSWEVKAIFRGMWNMRQEQEGAIRLSARTLARREWKHRKIDTQDEGRGNRTREERRKSDESSSAT